MSGSVHETGLISFSSLLKMPPFSQTGRLPALDPRGVCIDEALRHNAAYARVLSEHYRAESSSAPFKPMLSSRPPPFASSISLLLIPPARSHHRLLL
jgi:hypothetical protein